MPTGSPVFGCCGDSERNEIFFWGNVFATYVFSLIRLYFAPQRDVHATDNKLFSKFLVSTEFPNLFPSEQISDHENFSVAATV